MGLTLLVLHSWWRWVVLLILVASIGKATAGWLGKQDWTDLDEKLSKYYTMSFSIQLVLGFVLYFVSLAGAYTPFHYNASFMRLSMEHVLMMVIALVVAIVCRGRAKRTDDAVAKLRAIVLGFVLSLIFVMCS